MEPHCRSRTYPEASLIELEELEFNVGVIAAMDDYERVV